MDDPMSAVVAALARSSVRPRAGSIRFVKQRQDRELAAVAVEYDDDQDREWRGMVGLERINGAWRVTGAGGGSRAEPPHSSTPWANFAAVWDERLAIAGGRVYGVGVARVRMVSASGAAAEDTVEGGVALLIAAGPFPRPWIVELYDEAGALLRTHPCPGGRV